MIEEDIYCIDVLHQIQAVGSAITETEGIILENHLKTCALDSIKNGKSDEAVKEIMAVFKNK